MAEETRSGSNMAEETSSGSNMTEKHVQEVI